MALSAFHHPVDQKRFIFFEPNGTRTVVRDDDSFGLTIEQRLPNGEKRSIRYGNDQAGYELYIHTLRFLSNVGVKLPPFRLQGGLESKLLRASIESRIRTVNASNVPDTHQMDMDSTGTIAPVSLPNHARGLMMNQDGKPPLFFSRELLEGIAKVIPQLFPRNPYFHQIHAFYSQKANRKYTHEMAFLKIPKELGEPWTRPRRTRQTKIRGNTLMGKLHRKLKRRH